MPEPKTVKLSDGTTVELFYIGELASALGRSPQTVRRWEIAKVIPPTIFKDRQNRRLYTREQIDTLVSIAEKCEIQAGKAFYRTTFVKEATEAFRVLHMKYAPPQKAIKDRRISS